MYKKKILALQEKYNSTIKEITSEKDELVAEILSNVEKEFCSRFPGHKFMVGLSGFTIAIHNMDDCVFDFKTRQLFKTVIYGEPEIIETDVSLDELQEVGAELSDTYGIEVRVLTDNIEKYRPITTQKYTWLDAYDRNFVNYSNLTWRDIVGPCPKKLVQLRVKTILSAKKTRAL